MSEENQELVPESAPEATPSEEVKLSPIEQKAIEMGWRPKEEFEGDEENFIDAKEFVQRQPLFERIANQNKQLKRLEAALDGMKSHYTKVQETEYKRALADLKKQQEIAVEEGDLTKYHALNERREEIEEEHGALKQELSAPVEPEVHPVLQGWMAQNTWYETQPHMRVFADEVGAKFRGAVMAKTMTPDQVLKEIEKAVRAEFPTKFRNPNKDKPSAVEGSSAKGRVSSKEIELTDTERRIMNNLVQSKVLTKEQYLADLKKAKGL